MAHILPCAPCDEPTSAPSAIDDFVDSGKLCEDMCNGLGGNGSTSCVDAPPLLASAGAEVHLKQVAKDVESLKKSIQSLQADLSAAKFRLRYGGQSTEVCYIHVKVIDESLKANLGTTKLEDTLRCKILAYYIIISDIPCLKVKIAGKDLCKALGANINLVRVRQWSQWKSAPSRNPIPVLPPGPTPAMVPFRVTTWNCRGLNSGEPYLNHLASSGSDVIVVTEHWLWPFEEARLMDVHDDFKSVFLRCSA